MNLSQVKTLSNQVAENIGKVIIGKNTEVKLVLAAFLAGGHVLLEDVPGTGKTLLAKSLARSFDISFSRVQFTPDLLPSELTGINFFSPASCNFTFRKGSLFAHIILADEINRATPRTQSGLLESMEELQITVDGETYPLERPYFVIATQNPIETQGTFPLPEAQLDRFLIQLSLGYPKKAETVKVIKDGINAAPIEGISSVCTEKDFMEMREAVKGVFVHDDVLSYIAEIAEASRTHESVALGISTRGALMLAKIVQAYTAIDGREFVTPQDVKLLVPYVFAHRLVLRGGLRNRMSAAQTIIEEVVTLIKAPVETWKGTD